MRINANAENARNPDPLGKRGSRTMPLDTVAVLATIVFGFAVFAAVLLWGDFKTRRPAE
jgi:multisubunit Na+/H+ antiporter MnhC subunit